MYDPDSLALDRDQILKLIDETVSEYNDNRKVKAAAWFLKQFCQRCDKKELEQLWNTIAIKVNDIFIANSIWHAEANGEAWVEPFKLIDESKKDKKDNDWLFNLL